MLVPEKTKQLTEKQESFLENLFGQARGNPREAAKLAGYDENGYQKVVKSLKQEIIERAEGVLATHSPKAVMGMVNALDDDGSVPGANTRLEAAKQILDRVGISKTERIDVNAKVQHGIFILPPKNV
jgi:hypothetical protein|tara:strand:+ start:1309 stop:1689 length:381 start_codon:yes stop_codon:yes gene_type:complete